MSWTDAGRILAVRLDALGDVLMTTPALRALKAARPRRHLTLLASPAGAAVAALVPEIDDIVMYDAPWIKATAPRRGATPDLAMIERLRAGRFDGAVIFTVYSQSPLPAALLCYLAGVPLRLAHCRENPYQLLTEWVIDPEPVRFVRHEVRRQLDLVASVGGACVNERLSLRVPEDARHRVRDLVRGWGLEQRPWLLLHPGASAPSRRYPPELFARAARGFGETTGGAIVVVGLDGEPAIAEVLAEIDGVETHALTGLPVADLAALVEAAPVLVSNNSGPVHVAAAVGTPVVDLYALTNPQHTPWAVPHHVLFHDVPCKYCYKSICPEGHHDCLRRVSPDRVVAAALSLLPSGRTGGPGS